MRLNRRSRIIPYEGADESDLEVWHFDYYRPENNTYSDIHVDGSFIHSSLSGSQVTDSESHPGWNKRYKRRFIGDRGGPFYSEKRFTRLHGTSQVWQINSVMSDPWWMFPQGQKQDTWSYSGPVFPTAPDGMPKPYHVRSSDDSLDELGATAIARCSPSRPPVDLTTTIGELFHEGIPSIVGGTLQTWRGLSNRQRRKAIGSEYLNVEFGWKPLINDLLDFCRSIIHADRIFDQYQRGSGKMTRRGYDFPTELTTDTEVFLHDVSPWTASSSGGLTVWSELNRGQVIRTKEVRTRQWFRGAFTYYVPPSNSLRNDMARAVIQARKVLGISLTPDSLWNLAPWSWAVDWFFNTGDLLSNWTDWAIDNQVLLYGYMMEHKTSTWTYTFVGPTGLTGIAQGSVPSVSFVLETKVRQQATPYGFGLDWSGFSTRQLAILAALGLSRS